MFIEGETRLARDIGRRGRERYIWGTCSQCGRQRWVSFRQGKTRYPVCRACANANKLRMCKKTRSAHPLQTQVSPVDEKNRRCPPHWWIIDSDEVGRCKFCGALKDFGSILGKAMNGDG